MIRTIEVLFVVLIIAGAFIATSYFAVLPSPQQVSPLNLRRLSFSTLQMLDSNYDLSRAVFETNNASAMNSLQTALSASLPPNVIYNLTIYEVNQDGVLYSQKATVANTQYLGATTDVSTYTVASSNVTFNFTPDKIGGQTNGGTLYILNCSDACGWWITGYTAQSLAQDLYTLLSPYFVNTVMVQNTSELAQILNGTSLHGERVQNAVVINTYGEAVPIPTDYCKAPYTSDSYANYSYFLGRRVNLYNWTWTSIVGYPFYYVSNTVALASGQNNWGIYGMQMTGQGGARAFLQGLDKQTYYSDTNNITDSKDKQATFTPTTNDACNYYGIYPSAYQTATRALGNTILQSYNLTIGLRVFNAVGNYNPGAIYNHVAAGSPNITGSFLALGLTRTPDVRVTGLSLLSYYQPRVYASEYNATGTSRVAVLQLGMVGGG
jgi:hypothetical protein